MEQRLNDLVNEFVESKNHHDVNDIMRFYADNITSHLAGIWLTQGREAIQSITEWEVVMKPTYKISHIALFGDSVRCRLTESNEWLRIMGVESIIYEPFMLTFKDNRIAAINAQFSIDSFKIYQNAWTIITDWLRENNPEKLAAFFIGDKFKYCGTTAHQWLDLVSEYQKAHKK